MLSGFLGSKNRIVCSLKSEEFGGIDRPFTFTGKTQSYQGK